MPRSNNAPVVQYSTSYFSIKPTTETLTLLNCLFTNADKDVKVLQTDSCFQVCDAKSSGDMVVSVQDQEQIPPFIPIDWKNKAQSVEKDPGDLKRSRRDTPPRSANIIRPDLPERRSSSRRAAVRRVDGWSVAGGETMSAATGFQGATLWRNNNYTLPIRDPPLSDQGETIIGVYLLVLGRYQHAVVCLYFLKNILMEILTLSYGQN